EWLDVPPPDALRFGPAVHEKHRRAAYAFAHVRLPESTDLGEIGGEAVGSKVVRHVARSWLGGPEYTRANLRLRPAPFRLRTTYLFPSGALHDLPSTRRRQAGRRLHRRCESTL